MSRKKHLADTPDDTEVAFYDALGRADLDALMALWADDEEIVCIHPGAPRLIGHAAIRASWQAIFEQGGVHIHPLQLHVMQNMMAATHSVLEQMRGADDRQDRHVLATNVYVKTPLGWRIAVHHASVAPGKAAAEVKASTTLH
ncbi:ketosteroid isomerase-like protein [Actimicrobium sp. GrIS 1.19]|uniref:YybH family protein n=1 Tax=Actimicrobium sp. GrIS 1.19 TaxID=3071708 RepID=UPI002DFFF289|nr:ketosteroid isomerase-like protein [Actimicrobium sp. GrIS 1.19]